MFTPRPVFCCVYIGFAFLPLFFSRMEGTGEFEGAVGSLEGRFRGTFRATDTEDGKLQSFSNVNGTSELTIEY